MSGDPLPEQASAAPEAEAADAAAAGVARPQKTSPALPALLPAEMPSALSGLADQARTYARHARAQNTRRAYESDWRRFASWCRRRGLEAEEPNPETVGLYLAAGAAGEKSRRGFSAPPVSPATLERRLSALCWHYRQQGTPLDRTDRHILEVMAGIRRRHGRPPVQKEALLAEDLLAMLATLTFDLRGLRDRAILLLGFAGGLRRSEIVGLDCGPDETEDGGGWLEILDEGALLHINGKTGWRVVEVGRGSSERSCPVAALETWLRFAKIAHGPVFRRVRRKNAEVGPDRLCDKQVVRLVKDAALAAGLRGDLAEGARALAFGGHSLRAGLATSAEVDEAHVQRQLGHASAEMTRRYQRRRDRFRVNLTKAAGL